MVALRNGPLFTQAKKIPNILGAHSFGMLLRNRNTHDTRFSCSFGIYSVVGMNRIILFLSV